MTALGETVRLRREGRGLGQQQLAEALGVRLRARDAHDRGGAPRDAAAAG